MKVTERCFYTVLIITLGIIAILLPVFIIQLGNKPKKYVYLRPANNSTASRASFSHDFRKKYFTVEELSKYLQDFSAKRNLLFTTQELGKTGGGNPVHEVILKKRGTTKPMVFVVSGLVANDWGSILTTIQIMNQFFTDVQRTNHLLNYFSFHFLPLMNPDGYSFSMSLPIFSNWKKNYEGFVNGEHKGRTVLFGYDKENQMPKEVDIFKNYFIENRKSVKAAFFLFSPVDFNRTGRFLTIPTEWFENDDYKKGFIEELAVAKEDEYKNRNFEFVETDEPYRARIDQWVVKKSLPVPAFVANFLTNYRPDPHEGQWMIAETNAKDIHSMIVTFLEILHKSPV